VPKACLPTGRHACDRCLWQAEYWNVEVSFFRLKKYQ
jgi:hypothetical protein